MTTVDRHLHPPAPNTAIDRTLAILGTFGVEEPSLTLTQTSKLSGLRSRQRIDYSRKHCNGVLSSTMPAAVIGSVRGGLSNLPPSRRR